ncbi:VOC family protein [Amycolatopsis sp. NPDC059657]|uniref:VOC family protein n=1 Tax=Amycolatopsis sp. NPDC059657 TaxID=3346899 RepID=UPI00366B35BB
MSENNYPGRVTVKRMDNVGIVFEDLDAAVEFFLALGLELEGRTTVEGGWAERIVGLENLKVDIAMVRTPDGHNKLELMSYHSPKAIAGDPEAPVNTLGLRRLLFAVDDIDATLTRLRAHGAELIGEVVQIPGVCRMGYLRGPEGIMIALAEENANG